MTCEQPLLEVQILQKSLTKNINGTEVVFCDAAATNSSEHSSHSRAQGGCHWSRPRSWFRSDVSQTHPRPPLKQCLRSLVGKTRRRAGDRRHLRSSGHGRARCSEVMRDRAPRLWVTCCCLLSKHLRSKLPQIRASTWYSLNRPVLG